MFFHCLVFVSISLLQNPAAREKQQEPSQRKSAVAKQAASPTERAPLASNAGLEQQRIANEQAKWWPPPPPWDIYWPTLALVIATGLAVRYALKTLNAIKDQVNEMRESGKQTDKLIAENIAQSKSMEKSVAEAARLAGAMERIAGDIAVSSKAAVDSVAALRERTAQQMRAYVTVNIGTAVYQERNKGLRFEGKPLLINTGHTPARNVSFRTSAAILEAPLPGDFTFPFTTEIQSTATVGAGQNAVLSGIVEDFVDDAEVEDIKIGKAKRCLFVWGIVTYEDIFGESHYTKFCQSLFWQLDSKGVYGYYYPKHNDST